MIKKQKYKSTLEIPLDNTLKQKAIHKYKSNRSKLQKRLKKTSVSFIPKKDIFSIISQTRLRSKIPKEIINKVQKRLNDLPLNTFKTKILDKKYWWKGIDNTLPACTIDLPIVKVKVEENYHKFSSTDTEKPKWTIIKESCIVADEDTNRILAIFVYAKEDKNISCCLDKCYRLIELIEKYLKVKAKTFYSGYAGKIQPGFNKKTHTDILTKKTNRYTGKNWLEGMQSFFLSTIGRNITAYYHRDPEAINDPEYLEGIIWLYSCLYELEKRHCPAVAKYRYSLVKDMKEFPGSFPGFPIELNPSTCMGASINFSSDTHSDSSARGTTETIIWRPDKTNPKPYIFNNSLAKLYFDINDDCMIYQVGLDPHGTLNTGNHGGVGFVNLSKKKVCNKTPLSRKWYRLWDKYLQ